MRPRYLGAVGSPPGWSSSWFCIALADDGGRPASRCPAERNAWCVTVLDQASSMTGGFIAAAEREASGYENLSGIRLVIVLVSPTSRRRCGGWRLWSPGERRRRKSSPRSPRKLAG